MTGTLTLSIEVELGWGTIDKPSGSHREFISPGRGRETETLHRFLECCDRLDIPVTFDVVGHLLLDECDGNHEGPHPTGWFANDPGTDVRTDPEFYAPDLVDAIVDAETPHEICTHTFSHTPANRVSEAVLDWELRTARRTHDEHDVPLSGSLVPPRNRPFSRSVLQKNGIQTVRTRATHPLERLLGRTGEKATTLGRLVGRSNPVADPRRVGTHVETDCSSEPSLTAPFFANGQRPPHPVFRWISADYRRNRHRRFLQDALESAIERDAATHLWTHLFNMSNGEQYPLVEWLLEYAAECRDCGDIEISPMAELGGTQ